MIGDYHLGYIPASKICHYLAVTSILNRKWQFSTDVIVLRKNRACGLSYEEQGLYFWNCPELSWENIWKIEGLA